jgi:hypothetical protein
MAKTTRDNAISLTEFRNAVENIHRAWQRMTPNNMHGVWKCILPRCANSSDFEEETVVEEINIGRELGFVALENDDVLELLNSHSEELTDHDLLLDKQSSF